MKLKKGDRVQVMAGRDAGGRGKLIAVDPRQARVKVEKLNVVKRHSRPTQANPAGGILEKEAWMDASNVMLIDPKLDVPTRVGRRADAKGRAVRYAKKSGAALD